MGHPFAFPARILPLGPVPYTPPLSGYLISFVTERRGSAPVRSTAEMKFGEPAEEVAAYLAADGLCGHRLDAVHFIDLTPGRQRLDDCTADVLRLVTPILEADRNDLPSSLADAFDRHGVKAPISWSETDFREPYEAERLTAADCLPRLRA